MESNDSPRRKRLIVIGGGINGLAAAWSAWEASGGSIEILLLEASPSVGGKARTRRSEGWLFEEGPTGFLPGDDVLEHLIELAGLEAIDADRAAARRYVVRGGRAREIHMSPLKFAASGILSLGGLVRMAREPWIPGSPGRDESVWQFAARRLGAQAADRLIAPMTLGIFAGDARDLSLHAAFPRMAELERDHGSLFRALLAQSQLAKPGSAPKGPRVGLRSFREGMQSLPLALAERALFDLRTNASVTSLRRDAERNMWHVQVEGDAESLRADAVVLACDAHTSGRLLSAVVPNVAAELNAIRIPGLAVVGLGFSSPGAIRALPPGFGALIPRGEGYRILGCLFDDQLFEERAPAGHRLVRCMIGGGTDPEAVGLGDSELLGIAIDDLRRLFQLEDNPSSYEIARWPQAIPQYEMGHLQRLARIDRELDRFATRIPGLHLAGCHARGVAFGKTAAEGWRVGELVAKDLTQLARP